MGPSREVELGRIVGAHGLRGELRVRWLGDGPENLLAARRVAVAAPGDAGPRDHEVKRTGTGRAGEVRLLLEGVESREAAEALRGGIVRGATAPLPEGEHYWYELVDCAVETDAGRLVGRVREIWETGAHDVLVVERTDGATCLVPTARELLREIDVEAGRVVVEDRPGLFDAADRAAGSRVGSEECSGST